MDLNTVEAVRFPRRREEVWPLRPGDAIVAGGTWLFSEPRPHITRLIDVTALGWQPVTESDNGLELAATCTLAEVAELSTTLAANRPDWVAAPLFAQCCTALLASAKVWHTATVGGNICTSLPAGSMISLTSVLDATLQIWRGDGDSYSLPVGEFVTGAGTNALKTGEILRSIHVPAAALRARTAYRKLAPSSLGRSGVVVLGRHDDARDGGNFTVSVTAATVRPYLLKFPGPPTRQAMDRMLAQIPDSAWNTDAHGDPDWRAAMTSLLCHEIVDELT